MYKTCKKECNEKMGSPLCVFACVAYYSECFSDLCATHSDLENCL